MVTFRQQFIVGLISFGAAAGAVSQLPYADIGSILGAFWDIGTNKTIFPITLGLLLIVGLLLWWNPER